MGRLFLYGDEVYDLGNIKHIDTTPYSAKSDGCYVNIHLLKGREYLIDPDTLETKLFEPVIIKGFGKGEWAMSFIERLMVAWEMYLESRTASSETI